MKEHWESYNLAVEKCKDVPARAIIGEVKGARHKKSKRGNLSITVWVYNYSGGGSESLLCLGEHALLYRWLLELGNELRFIVRDVPSYTGQMMQQIVYVEPLRMAHPMPYLVYVGLPKTALVNDMSRVIQKCNGPILCKMVAGHKERDGEVNLKKLKEEVRVFDDYEIIEFF